MTDFLITELQHVFQTRRQDYKLLPKRRDLIAWITTGRHALQSHLCRQFWHLLPCIFLAVSFRKSIVIVTDLCLLWSALAVFWTTPPQIICLSTIVTSSLFLTGVLILRFQSGRRHKRIWWCYFPIIQRLICIRGGGRSMKYQLMFNWPVTLLLNGAQLDCLLVTFVLFRNAKLCT